MVSHNNIISLLFSNEQTHVYIGLPLETGDFFAWPAPCAGHGGQQGAWAKSGGN